MITESDLRAVLTDEARDVSEPDEVLTRLRMGPPTKRRWIAPVAAAAAVAAVVATALALVHTRPDAKPAPAHPLPGNVLRFTTAVGPVAGYDTTHRMIVAYGEVTDVQLLDAAHRPQFVAWQVVAYNPGAYDPRTVMGGQRTTVQGRPAYFRDLPTRSLLWPTLAWQANDGRWISVRGLIPSTKSWHPDPLTEERRIAAAFRLTAPHALRLPFRAGPLPTGLALALAQSPIRPTHSGEMGFAPVGRPANGALVIAVAVPDPDYLIDFNTTVDGHPARIQKGVSWAPGYPFVDPMPSPPSTELVLDLGRAHLTVTGTYPVAELAKIAKSVQVASNVSDPSTWYYATK